VTAAIKDITKQTRRARYADKLELVNNDNYTLPEVPTPLFSKNKCEQWRRETVRQDRQPKAGLLPIIPNGRNDPFSIVPVIDLIMRLKGLDIYIVASAFTDLLSVEYPYIRWDYVTVGRILSALAETAEALHLQPNDSPPIVHTKWNDKRVYSLFHSIRGHQWWAACRDAFAEEAIRQNVIFRDGGTFDTSPTVWTIIEPIELGGLVE
jgi:hypothetical protein